MAYEIIAVVTNTAKSAMAEALATGKSFKIDNFALGSNGHDPTNPTTALTPDPSQTECVPGSSPMFGPEPIDSYAYTGSFCPEFTCRVEEGEAVGVISSLCLIATYVYSPTPGDPDVGTTFLYGIAHMPFWAKTDQDSREWKVTLRF